MYCPISTFITQTNSCLYSLNLDFLNCTENRQTGRMHQKSGDSRENREGWNVCLNLPILFPDSPQNSLTIKKINSRQLTGRVDWSLPLQVTVVCMSRLYCNLTTFQKFQDRDCKIVYHSSIINALQALQISTDSFLCHGKVLRWCAIPVLGFNLHDDKYC